MKQSPDRDQTIFRGFALTTAIGSELAGCVIGGVYLGRWLDEKFNTSPWLLLIGVLIGLTAGIMGITVTVKQFYKN